MAATATAPSIDPAPQKLFYPQMSQINADFVGSSGRPAARTADALFLMGED
jgi:hypothetical protein